MAGDQRYQRHIRSPSRHHGLVQLGRVCICEGHISWWSLAGYSRTYQTPAITSTNVEYVDVRMLEFCLLVVFYMFDIHFYY